MSVRLLFDYAGITEPEKGQKVVAEIGDYAAAYDRMARALHAGEKQQLVVRDRTCAAWFRVAQGKYGAERIEVVEITHVSKLAEGWGVTVPEWVSDAEIEASHLLDVDLRAAPGQSFENVLLERFCSPFLVYDRLPLNYLVDILMNYQPSRWLSDGQRPLVKKVLRRRLDAWEEVARSDGERYLIGELRRDPARLMRTLAHLKVLQGYPAEVGQRVLGDTSEQLCALELDLSALPVKESEVRDTVDQVRVYLNQMIKKTPSRELAVKLLQQVSGYLVAEYEAVESLLRHDDVAIDAELLNDVRRAFAPIRERLASQLATLDLLVEPPRPRKPNSSWEVEDWLNWAVSEYLPYRFWLEEVGRHDDELAEFASQYGDWLYDNFRKLGGSYENLVYRAISNCADQLRGDDPVLFIVIDNFNYKFFPDFKELMQTRGYFCETPVPYLSMLPSATEVSKKCLFVGQPRPFDEPGYRKAVEDTWSRFFRGRRVRYLGRPGELQGVMNLEHDLYFLNYLPVDRALHSDEEDEGVPHAEAVRQRLRNLAKQIQDFGQRLQIEDRLRVIICSDHGSTRIPAEVPNIINKAFYSSRVTDKHHRYVSISDEELADLPDNARFQCYFIERVSFNLPQNYLAARGYYRFLKTEESFYVHGGLTPEETIIPLAMFAHVVVTPKDLSIRLLQDEFRYGVKATIQLELMNANEYPCTELELSVLSPKVHCEGARLEELPALETELVTIDARFARRKPDPRKLDLRISYRFLDRPYGQQVSLPITMKSMMEITDLDELLEG